MQNEFATIMFMKVEYIIGRTYLAIMILTL